MNEYNFSIKRIVKRIGISILCAFLLYLPVISFIAYIRAQDFMQTVGQQLLEMLSEPLAWIGFPVAFVLVFLMISLKRKSDYVETI